MRMILRSTFVNDDAFDIAKNDCLPEHNYLIEHYWGHNFRDYITISFYKRNNHINKESIMEALTK